MSIALALQAAQERPYHWEERLRTATEVCRGLAHLHKHRPKIFHRDIKSQNVFLTSSGSASAVRDLVVKLGDFGVARVLDASENLAATRIGTPHNMPPEMCENSPYDFKADVWGLGVMLYEMLALEVPFNAPSFSAR